MRANPLSQLFKAHPWHGVPIGDAAPEVVTCYIEIVPSDTVKYEIDKGSGLLKIDRPQKFSNVCPTLYGLVPQTLCADRVGARCAERSNGRGAVGDGDPLDICVIAEGSIPRGDILLRARPVGGLRLVDGDEADDKIIAVMASDASYGGFNAISELPAALLDRLRHYFLTYKELPGEGKRKVEIAEVYDRSEAHEVINRSREDYRSSFGDLEQMLREIRGDGAKPA